MPVTPVKFLEGGNDHILALAVFQFAAGIDDKPAWIEIIFFLRPKQRAIDALKNRDHVIYSPGAQDVLVPG